AGAGYLAGVQAPDEPGGLHRLQGDRDGSVVGPSAAGATGTTSSVALGDVAAVADERPERDADRDQALGTGIAAGAPCATDVVVVTAVAAGHRRTTEQHRPGQSKSSRSGRDTGLTKHLALSF